MCGRYTLSLTAEILLQHFGLDDLPSFTPRYNIAPSQPIATIRAKPGSSKRKWAVLRWGLIPAWAKDLKIGSQMINAKAETVEKKPAFRSAFRKRRCLIPADGFYEWQRQGRYKQPMYICLRDKAPFAFAGLWERWGPLEGEPIESCTILTTEPNNVLRPIHNRMPVILDPKNYEQWLDTGVQEAERLKPLLRPYPSEQMTAYSVSTRVNNPRNDDPQCLHPVSGSALKARIDPT